MCRADSPPELPKTRSPHGGNVGTCPHLFPEESAVSMFYDTIFLSSNYRLQHMGSESEGRSKSFLLSIVSLSCKIGLVYCRTSV